ncbi:TonB-dependent receptor [Altererythrobacter xixiisoli]|uniref:TonB-dependent receptor n=1 Tax=Croceibacterium xixiisoli TaxID=1476466 RepID=A0A6I4TYZ5_9SPHN|nr:TonB-dependent receptor [Croceibacterium xixiisoli]MXP00340.1 TonB-dependent receptor [Croceibacterium xixiisoli]
MSAIRRPSRPSRCLLLCGAPVLALSIFAAPAHAAEEQAAEGQPADAGEAIIVTGYKIGRGETRAVAALGRDDINERPFGADITQSLNKVPGLQVTTGDARGGSFSFEFAMRGLNKEQVGFTLDGIPTGDARFNGGSPPQRFIESSNVQRITVSQSAGDLGAPSRFALGGFVDFVTDDPARRASATLEAGFGSDDFWRGYIRLDSGEIAPGLSAYASYSRQENDVWTGPDSRHSSREHAEFKLVKMFDDGSFLKGRVSWNDQQDNDFNIISLAEFRADPRSDQATDALTGIPATDVNFGGALGGTRQDFMAYLNMGWQLGDTALLTLNPYYQTLRGESYRYQDRARALTGSNPYAVTGYNANGGAIRPALITTRNSNALGGPADMRVTPRDRDRYGATAELKLENLIAGHTIRVGGWWEGGTSSEERQFFRITDPVASIAYDSSRLNYVEYQRWTSIETTMLYAQDSVEIVPDLLRLDVGVNWLNVAYKTRSPLEYSAQLDFSQHSDINPKIGFKLTPMRRLEIYGGYAKNFAGIPEDAFLGSTAVITPTTLEPIQSETFDLGLRYTTDNLALSVQAYSVDLKNNIGIVPNDTSATEPDEILRGNVATRAANILGQRTRGIEVTGLGQMGPIDVYASYSYQDARHDDPAIGSTERAQLAAVGVIGGARVRNIPRHSAYAEIGVRPVEGARIQANLRYVGDRVGGHIVANGTYAEVSVETIPSYVVAGVSATYELTDVGPLRGLTFQLNVDNLFDKAYLGSVSSSTATQPEFALPAITLDRYFLGSPRTYTLSLRAKI